MKEVTDFKSCGVLHRSCVWLRTAMLMLTAAMSAAHAADAAASTPAPADARADTRLATTLTAAATSPVTPELRLPAGGYQYPTFPGSSFEAGTYQSWGSRHGAIQLFEVPRDYTPGQPIRFAPHLALSFRSNALRRSLDSMGLDTESCMAPIFRLRGKLLSGASNGTLWVSARCSFW